MSTSLLEQFKAGEVSEEIKKVAARGVLPVSQEELIEILVLLSRDPDPDLARQARESLAAFPDEVIKPLLESAYTAELVFDYFSHPPLRSKILMEAMILNTAAPDEVVARLADQVESDLMEAVLVNLMRMLRCPAVLEALERNPHNTPDTRRRLEEIRFEFFEKRNTFVPVAPFNSSQLLSSSAASAQSAETVEAHPLTTEESAEAIIDATTQLMREDGEEVAGERVTVLQKIARMTVAERVILAMKGSRDERAVLIRDCNKVVGRAVLQSPKLTENEVEWIAQMKNVSEEVLRQIGLSRKWMKNYSIAHNLVRNARAPLATTLPLLNRLLTRDLRTLSMNKNIPEVLRRTAQRLVQTRHDGR